ncbi:CaiB/BaiF CoA transferase family protein [Sphingobium estronivorans]|uniref:CaiB/BaiF CoA transferase family protein n=1 Tax=Sphingobium estronivorans TaxID=1577690 RepID=UPI00123BBC62|nr:CaiB/BaiF CoA-transferase family protein [Sphingobium estronivorans]
MKPLEEITVVSLEHAIAAPFATRQLADLGARVIKVERPGSGDFARNYDERVRGLSSHFVWCNRSKESIELDLKSDFGLEALRALIRKADVVVQNLAPGSMQRLGLDYQALKAINPGIIMCEISGYGQDGPHRDRKAYDLLIQAESGFLSVTGDAADVAKAGCSIADIAAGMYAYSNILSALLLRRETGEGRHIDISMLEAMAEWMSFPMYYGFEGAAPPPRAGASHATIYPYGPFQANDGSVMLGVQNEREWASFCDVVLLDRDIAHDERFRTNSLRSANRGALKAIIEKAFAELLREEVLRRLDAAKIANASVSQVSDLWTHPQLAARGRWTQVGSGVGSIPALLPPGQTAARMDPVPKLGEHTTKILADLGLSECHARQG